MQDAHPTSLEDAIEAFAGCAVIISHDRFFLDRLCTHILAFEGEAHVEWFEGSPARVTFLGFPFGFDACAKAVLRSKTACGTRLMCYCALEPKRIKHKKFTRWGGPIFV